MTQRGGSERWMFQDVDKGGPALVAGIRPGDLLLECHSREALKQGRDTQLENRNRSESFVIITECLCVSRKSETVRPHSQTSEYAECQHRSTCPSDTQRRGDGDNGVAFLRCITNSHRPTIHATLCLQHAWRGSALETGARTIASLRSWLSCKG